HAGEIRRALLVTPDFLHRLHVVRGELPDVAVAAGHLEEPTVARGPTRSFFEFDLSRLHLHAGLAQRKNDDTRVRVEAHGLPVLAAFRAGARLHPRPDSHRHDVGPILRRAGLRIDAIPDVLVDRFLVT